MIKNLIFLGIIKFYLQTILFIYQTVYLKKSKLLLSDKIHVWLLSMFNYKPSSPKCMSYTYTLRLPLVLIFILCGGQFFLYPLVTVDVHNKYLDWLTDDQSKEKSTQHFIVFLYLNHWIRPVTIKVKGIP